jgi:hypothetical protein
MGRQLDLLMVRFDTVSNGWMEEENRMVSLDCIDDNGDFELDYVIDSGGLTPCQMKRG